MEQEAARNGILVGLTGTYCAGKNHVARLLEERGFEVLDVDKLGHQVLEEEKEAIAGLFGAGVFNSAGAVDRKALGAAVFGKTEALAALESIVHPGANRLVNAWIANGSPKPKVINAALLHRTVIFEKLNHIILVRAPLITRILRARKRDGLSLGALMRRFGSQKDFTSQYLSRKSDIHIVENRGFFTLFSRFNQKRLERQIDRLVLQLR
jgi:dephospho-CoA kinase